MLNLRPAGRGMAMLVMLATLAVVIVNFLAATGRINGVMPNEISDKYPTVITPAGWAFSIWGLIYVGLIAFSIYQLLPSHVSKFARMRLPYILSCVLNCAWILFWHHWHVAICLAILISLEMSLIWIVLRLGSTGSLVEALLTKGVFGLYAGWVSVACLLNIFVALVATGVDLSSTAWELLGLASLILAMMAAILARIFLRNFTFSLAVAWAATAIGAAQSGKNTAIVVTTALVCIGALIIAGTVVTELRDSTSE